MVTVHYCNNANIYILISILLLVFVNLKICMTFLLLLDIKEEIMNNSAIFSLNNYDWRHEHSRLFKHKSILNSLKWVNEDRIRILGEILDVPLKRIHKSSNLVIIISLLVPEAKKRGKKENIFFINNYIIHCIMPEYFGQVGMTHPSYQGMTWGCCRWDSYQVS